MSGTPAVIRCFVAAVQQLPEQQRAVLRMASLDGLSVAEIAADRGMTRHQVVRTIADAMGSLRPALAASHQLHGHR